MISEKEGRMLQTEGSWPSSLLLSPFLPTHRMASLNFLHTMPVPPYEGRPVSYSPASDSLSLIRPLETCSPCLLSFTLSPIINLPSMSIHVLSLLYGIYSREGKGLGNF